MTKIRFESHPDFKPNLTPKQVIERGSFGGTYFRPIYSSITKKNYKDVYRKYIWAKNIPLNKLTSNIYNTDINYYKAKSCTTLEMWESSGWITKYDPYGWFEWYCNFYEGRRCPDDDRQVKRWLNIAGPNGRFKKRILNQINNNQPVSRVILQLLQHWGVEVHNN